jgi:hypothetical protein
VVDRIVDGAFAVLLVGEAESERIEPVDLLPEGTVAGDWLRVRYRGDALVEATPDAEATDQARERIAAKLALLRRRGSRAQRDEG